MPLLKTIVFEQTKALVWKIEEPISFFLEHLVLTKNEDEEYAMITNDSRRLEWAATRFLQRQLVNDSLVKNEFGKPFLNRLKGHISLSHCKGYSAVSFNPTHSTGIDIEPQTPKILRIYHKFVNNEELSYIKNNEITYYTFIWCAKETIYKWYGKKQLDFKRNIIINPFLIEDSKINATFKYQNKHKDLKLKKEVFSDILLTIL